MDTKNLDKILSRKKELLQRTAVLFETPVVNVEGFFGQKDSILRINKIKVSDPNSLSKKIGALCTLKKVEWADSVYIIQSGKEKLTKTAEFEQGLFYIQNAASLLPVLALNPMQGETILDTCAAPGGKTIFLAELTQNKANITANDADHLRVGNMKKLCEIYGAKIDSFYSQPAQFLTKHLEKEYFDKILIDAPCSGEGMINLENEDSLKYWSKKKIKRLSKLQKRIIKEAYELLKPGGILIYSTCTLAPEENEEIIEYALQTYSDLELEQPFETNVLNKINMRNGTNSWQNKTYANDLSKCKRVVPNKYMEAFFIAKLKKRQV